MSRAVVRAGFNDARVRQGCFLQCRIDVIEPGAMPWLEQERPIDLMHHPVTSQGSPKKPLLQTK